MSPVLANRAVRLALLAVAGIALAGAMIYMGRRSSCEADERAITGEVRRASSGVLLYFDGRCWTRKPVPPTDTPF